MSDTTRHTAWAFPGMEVEVRVDAPAQYRGIQSVTYAFTPQVFDTATTQYDLWVGEYSLTAAMATTFPPANSTTRTDTKIFYLPKDPGTVSVQISMVAYTFAPGPVPTTDTIIDTVTLKIEAPTVNSFQIAGYTPGVPTPPAAASPFWFGRTDQNGDPSASGSNLAFAMAAGTPPVAKWIGMYANVTNATHYDLEFGFVQILNHVDYQSRYSDDWGSQNSGDQLLDLSTDPNIDSYWYNAYRYNAAPGFSGLIPLERNNQGLAVDSPSYAPPASNGRGNWYTNDGWLQTVDYNLDFSTSVIVSGGHRTPGGPGVHGVPIGLSTARWHLSGSASNATNINFPQNANAASTFALANWTTSLGAGAGGSPGPPPWVNAPWTSTGDGVRKYLQWSDSVLAIRGNNVITGAAPNLETSPSRRHDPEGRSDSDLIALPPHSESDVMTIRIPRRPTARRAPTR